MRVCQRGNAGGFLLGAKVGIWRRQEPPNCAAGFDRVGADFGRICRFRPGPRAQEQRETWPSLANMQMSGPHPPCRLRTAPGDPPSLDLLSSARESRAPDCPYKRKLPPASAADVGVTHSDPTLPGSCRRMGPCRRGLVLLLRQALGVHMLGGRAFVFSPARSPCGPRVGSLRVQLWNATHRS